MKQRLVSLARGAGLLPAFDALRFMRSKWTSAAENARFRETHPDFDPPPLWWMHDMYRHTSYDLYWRTGQETAAALASRIDAHVKTQSPRVADWGCGLARVLRHLPERYKRTGFDYNARAVNWCTDHIKGAQFFHNGLMPPLPASNASFDALYALSVFTHLSEEAHDAWIHDIARVLAPGGVFLGAFHMKLSPGQLLPEEQARFDAGKLVVRGRVKEGSRTYVAYHPESWLRSHLFHNWEILEGPIDFFGQSLFIARRP
ncbi:class I SAM-dependent methyltransferase [Hyphococcus sp.]|uniref:class I SAM-dependent methyltransferase n=1 Tax=Hyphococcus sp. TaxID=2038636 RepID=UPI003D10186F